MSISRHAELRDAAASAVQYNLIFKNDSVNPGNACVFQQDPDLGVENVMSLAWFSKYATPTTQVQFSWGIDYCFVWGQTGELVPGVIFAASQTWPADLSTSNAVTLDYDAAHNAFTFENQTSGTNGILTVFEDGTIPLNDASVGIGMSGAGTFVLPAQPNLQLNFTPHPTYYIAFGNYFPGQVLNISEMTNVQEIQFPTGIYTMKATLTAQNTWVVTPVTTLASSRSASVHA